MLTSHFVYDDVINNSSCRICDSQRSYDDTCDHVATPELCYGYTVGAKDNNTEEAPFVLGAYGDATLPKPILAYPNLRSAQCYPAGILVYLETP